MASALQLLRGGQAGTYADFSISPVSITVANSSRGEPFLARWFLFLGWHRVMFVDDLPLAILFTKAHGEAELQLGRTAA